MAVFLGATGAEDETTWLHSYLLSKVAAAMAQFLLDWVLWLWPTIQVEGFLNQQLLGRSASLQSLNFLPIWTVQKPLVLTVLPDGSHSPMSYIVFFRHTRYFNDISFDAIYRDIFTIYSKCKLGQNAPKFHSWSAYVEIFATKWPTCGIFIRKHHTLGFFLH